MQQNSFEDILLAENILKHTERYVNLSKNHKPNVEIACKKHTNI